MDVRYINAPAKKLVNNMMYTLLDGTSRHLLYRVSNKQNDKVNYVILKRRINPDGTLAFPGDAYHPPGKLNISFVSPDVEEAKTKLKEL